MRATLVQAVAALSDTDISREQTGLTELVLAEVLNNIVEHAYAGRQDGQISLQVTRTGRMLRLDIRDQGTALLGERLPPARAVNLDVPRDELPEGGFGWYLIHRLAHQVEYRRSGADNHLAIRLDLDTLQ